ncbi:hypothetical protein [Streptomonospora litoralis]|nr:hypothetical protein [Streptomonospora litoralis]
MRDLNEASTAGQEATAALMTGRLRWAVLGGGVFAGSGLIWLMGPEGSEILQLVLLGVALVAFLLGMSARWGWLTGRRARLTGAAGRRARTLTLLTMLGASALFLSLNAAVQYVLGASYPVIPGAVVGLVLALGGPHFAQWWLAKTGSRR